MDTMIHSQRFILVIDSARVNCYYSVWWRWWRSSASSRPQTLMYITRCLLLFQMCEHNSLPPSAALLRSHRRCCAHISGESRCLWNHCPLKVLHGIAGQSDFWGVSSRDRSPEPWRVYWHTVHHQSLRRLRPSTLPHVLQQLVWLLPQQYNHSVPRLTTFRSLINYFLKNNWLLQTTRTTASTTVWLLSQLDDHSALRSTTSNNSKSALHRVRSTTSSRPVEHICSSW
jgi:hypothetical protein